MNNGKICVSICAETADEIIEQIKRGEKLADVIEIRFDCFNENNFDLAVSEILKLKCLKPFLATFRPKEKDVEIIFSLRVFENKDQEQKVIESQNYRFSGWRKILTIENISFLDFEEDILLHLFISESFGTSQNESHNSFSKETYNEIKRKVIIASEHFFENVPTDLTDTYESLKTEESDTLRNEIIKIAVQTNDIVDAIPVWKLLKKAKSENKQIIPIAMGEAGKWTRILGLAHGAFMTYASLEAGKETALGQVSAQDLIETYRVKELNEQTEIYGIIGANTTYSMSPYIHNAAFKFHDLNSVFVPFQVQDLDEFIRRMVKEETREIELDFKGFSVTIPHKQSIIKHLDFINETAKAIGAVNTVKIVDGKLHGYNTDADGFIEPLKMAYGELKDVKVAILGNGGAARACIYALKKENADVTIFARDLAKAETLANEFEIELKELNNADFNDFDIVVNATPLGTKGILETETPAVAEQISQVKLVYDLVYNPCSTKFLKEAKSVFVPTIGGMAMLIAQAMKQSEIWTGKDAPMKEMSQTVLKRLS